MRVKKVAIVGWSGYSGLELVKLVQAHPCMELAACFSRDLSKTPSQFLGNCENIEVFTMDSLVSSANQFDTLFFATPISVSEKWIPQVTSSSAKIIDLSGAFRLGTPFTYGLQPWQPEVSHHIANPGCYVTSVLMALLPLLKSQAVDPKNIVVDAKSGTTGAGKTLAPQLLFGEVSDNCTPYKVGKHQHQAEIENYLEKYGGTSVDLFFNTHLMPYKRGILSSIYCKTQNSQSEIQNIYDRTYSDYKLVNVKPLGEAPQYLKMDHVVGTAQTNISYEVVGEKLFLFSCIDNLLKGAASQAIENWNVMHELPSHYFLESLR